MESVFSQSESLIEFIHQDQALKSTENRNKLIRILSRSSNLPKVHNINIHLHSSPDGFSIQPGKSMKIGTAILADPLVALVHIRYGLEWQIWYRSQSTEKIDPRLCDMAACQVTAKFYDTLSQEDKKALLNFPKNFYNIFRKFKTQPDSVELTAEEYAELGKMHKMTYPENPLQEADLEIVRNLALPLEHLLMSGGDKRLQIDKEQLLNKYGCSPFPRPKAFTFASSTATSISNIAFNQAEVKREELIKDCFESSFEKTIKAFSEEIKSRLKSTLALSEDTSVILAPSGTDVSLLFAGLCQTLFSKTLVHILVASDETGSGVPAALKGLHFSELTSQEVRVEKGEKIKGFEEVDLYEIPLKKAEGSLKTTKEIDEEVRLAFEEVVKQGKQPILHVMNQSKLGYVAPSNECLTALEERYGEQFFALIDNSQMRMGRAELRNYINHNYAMTITGSKFFTAPPFCGALLLPKSRVHLLGESSGSIPTGLKEYAFKNDFPPDWKSVERLKSGSNLGTLMRWKAAIVEQERYFKTPVLLRTLGTEMFCMHVMNSIENAGFLHALTAEDKRNKPEDPIASQRSIFSFFLLKDEEVLSLEETRKVYHLLNQKLSRLFKGKSEDLITLSNQVCHIGQPVKAVYRKKKVSGVLRISLGARVISESWKEQDVSLYFQKIQEQMIQVNTIIRKIKLILDHPEWWEE